MILWLTPQNNYTAGIKAILSSTLYKNGVKAGSIIFNSLHYKAPLLSECDEKKMLDKFAINQALKVLDDELKQLKPSLIVVNDQNTLRAIVGKKYNLATVRGSLYYYRSVPVIVIDGFSSIRFKKFGKFVFELDLAKIARWAKNEQHNEPAFDYRLCKTVDEVALHAAAAENATMVSCDRETSNGFTTCITYTYDDRAGKLISFVVPFFNPFREDGAYWESEDDEKRVRKLLKNLDASPVVKAFQNGSYDAAYAVLEDTPPVNYFVDTQNLMHSIWVEAPKKLQNIASYFVDYYTYWKDENKGVREDDKWKNRDELERYWRYCGLDGYYTYLGAVALLQRIVKLPWALRNYSMEFGISVGPCLAASLVGIKTDRGRHGKIVREQAILAEKGKQNLRDLSGEDDFNINSPQDVAWLLYDVLGAKKTRLQRKGSKYNLRSTDEKVLRLMKEQLNPFVTNAIDRLLKAKKPTSWLSKYGNWYNLTYAKSSRFLSWHNAAGTETFRLNSGDSQFWCGTNGQNLQPFTQEMFVADDDFVFVDCDYSASDDWFIAYEAEDEKKIEVLKTKDVHSYHASIMTKIPYEKIVAGKKNHEDWVINAITGVRQVFKKVAHGRNFRMEAEMLYNLMGRDMAVAAAALSGMKNPEGLADKELIGMCAHFIDLYDDKRKGMYKRIRYWQDEIVEELKKNGNNATNAFGITRHFFGSADDHATQRELSAYYGQSGTSGNINRALRKIFYGGIVDGRTCFFLLQVHDSLKFLVHKSVLASKIAEIKAIMEEPLEIKGRTFHVPTAIEVGLSDGKCMVPWRADLTYGEILKHEHDTYDLKFPSGNDALLNELENINFETSGNSELEKELDLQLEDNEEELENV